MVVISDEMQDSVHYHAVKFLFGVGSIIKRIFLYAIDADEEVAGEYVALAIVEGYDICEIVM